MLLSILTFLEGSSFLQIGAFRRPIWHGWSRTSYIRDNGTVVRTPLKRRSTAGILASFSSTGF